LKASTPFGIYHWNDGSTASQITVKTAGTYSVEVQNGCARYSDEIKIFYRNECCQIDVPNVFTPNNDAVNDFFEIRTESTLIHFSIVIYNRWGKEIYATNEMRNFWNGEIENQEASTGVYFWESKIACRHLNEISEKIFRGYVTVFR